MPKLDRHYISEDELFLASLSNKYPLSPSQKREIEKHWRIAKLRDDPEFTPHEKKLWE